MKNNDLDKHIIAIDLGTSNSVLYYWDIEKQESRVLSVNQIHSKGKSYSNYLLPSQIFIASDDELLESSKLVPWITDKTGQMPYVVGRWAQEMSKQQAHKVISSSKSWLCHPDTDQQSSLLPYGSDISNKITAPKASELIVRYLLEAYLESQKNKGYEVNISECYLTVTVPASFDENARRKTEEAARNAGIKNLQLLEEPQAALYSWIASNSKSWRDKIISGDLILVCDIGGGTTDLSLIYVSEEKGELQLERVSVGRHLLLGGDNIDLSIAYFLKQKLKNTVKEIDKWQFLSLVSAAREAKEKILSSPKINEYPIAVASKGSSIFSNSISTSLNLEELKGLLLNGFSPLVK